MDIYVIDRIEGNFAVCEKNGEEIIDISLSALPDDVHEGSVLTLNEDGTFTQNKDEEEKLRQEAFDFAESLFDE